MAQILVLIEQAENRRLLQEYLRQYYDVIVGDTAVPTETALSLLHKPFDLCILDGVALAHWQSEIQSRKQQELPVFLPILLIALRPDINFLTRNLWESVDELIKKPIDKLELRVRVEMLLRSRRFSLQLDASSKRERELNELKSRFISIASHEFRNPLNRISGFTQLLEKGRNSIEQRESCLERIQKAVDEMITLLDDVLATVKSEASRLTFNPVAIALKPFCRNLIEEVQLSTAPSRTINFVWEGHPTEAHFDVALLRQILTNLLSNALKYSSPDSTVHFRVRCQSESAIFEIQDEGIGIAAPEQQRLFDAFYRATNVGEIAGTGLGLSIVKQAVEQHGGTISLLSEINVGTTFTVMLPLILDVHEATIDDQIGSRYIR